MSVFFGSKPTQRSNASSARSREPAAAYASGNAGHASTGVGEMLTMRSQAAASSALRPSR